MLRNIRQGYRSWALIGCTDTAGTISAGTRVMCRPGAGLSEPRNLDIPYPLSNAEAEIDIAEGLHYPNVSLPLIPQSSWFTHENILAWFHTRGSDDAVAGYDDLATLGAILFTESNQHSVATNFGQRIVYKAKGGGYTLSFSKGEPIGFNAQFGGVHSDILAAVSEFPASGRSTGAPLNFSGVTFGGCLAGTGIIGGSLEVNTGLTPNPEMDYEVTVDTDPHGTAVTSGNNVGVGPKELNAGLLTAMLTLQTNAGAPLTDSDGLTGALAGTIQVGADCKWTLSKLICQNPWDRQQQAGRVVRTWRYKVMGVVGGSNVVGPCVVVSAP